MGKLVHTSRVRIEKDKGPKRRAYIEGFETPVTFGVHSNIDRVGLWATAGVAAAFAAHGMVHLGRSKWKGDSEKEGGE